MTELWLDSTIDKDWLEWFGDSWRTYDNYLKEKQALEKKINVLQSVDFSREHVTNGSPNRTSEQERFAIRLEKINALIKECESILFPAKQRLKAQILRINRSEYRRVLILRYIERWKWSDIIEECFWYEPDFDKNDTKYKDKILQWNRAALTKLEELNNKPYVPDAKQLNIISTRGVDA